MKPVEILQQAIQSELDQLSPQVIIDRKNLDLHEPEGTYVTLRFGDEEAVGISESVLVAKTVHEQNIRKKVEVSIDLPDYDKEATFFNAVADRLDKLFEGALVQLALPHNFGNSFDISTGPDSVERIPLRELEVTIGRNEKRMFDRDRKTLENILSSEALDRIRESIDWSIN